VGGDVVQEAKVEENADSNASASFGEGFVSESSSDMAESSDK
jgi:hypothetical protein